MIIWGGRVVTFITNSLVLVGYALLYTTLVSRQEKGDERPPWFYDTALVTLTIGFLALFHFASVFGMAQAGYIEGFGWIYINFQIATLLFALLASRRKPILLGLLAVIITWYWWLPRVPMWPLYGTISLILMNLASFYGKSIGKRREWYYPFSLAFAAPFLVANYDSVNGIDVGWPWQIATFILLAGMLWAVQYQYKRLRQHEDSLAKEVRIDELTQLNNFRVFNEDLQMAYNQMQMDGTMYSMFTFDIDHFKRINDQYGHLVGNMVLEQVSRRLVQVTQALAHDSRCYRTGGEEFTFIVFNVQSNFARASEIATEVKDALSQLRFTTDHDEEFGITISIGQDRVLKEDQNYLDLYNRADKYLYNSKRYGRNTITIRGITLSDNRNKPY